MQLLCLSLALAADLDVGPAATYTNLADAFDAALDGDRILVEPGAYEEPELDAGTRTLVVEATAAGVSLTTTANRRAFRVDGGDLTVIGVDFDGLDDVGLLQLRGGRFEFREATVSQARAPIPGQPGGSIDAADGTVVIADAILDGAVSPVKEGGHIYAERTDVTLTRSVIRGGSASSGGGVYVSQGSLLVDTSTFESNGGDEGVAITAVDSDVTVTSSRFEGNGAALADVVRCVGGTSCALSDVTFQGNGGQGALLAVSGVGASFSTGTVCLQDEGVQLLAVRDGGSLEVTGSALFANGTTVSGMSVDAGSTLSLINDSLVLNTVSTALVDADGPVTMTNNLVALTTSVGAAVQVRGGLSGGYNLYWANSGGDVAAPLATDILETDPLIGSPMAGSCDLDPLKPVYGSPLVDAGDPTILDADGSVSDIGAFGGVSPNPGTTKDDDLDGDGFGIPTDCDDLNPDVSPGQPETPCNGVDDDCNADTPDDVDADGDGVGLCDGDCDDEEAGAQDIVSVYLDQDGDGYGVGEPAEFCLPPTNSAPLDGDCDDQDPGAYPDATEVPYDGVDQDCDGEDLDDLDGDGALGAVDCDDEDPRRYPDATDTPDDGIDQDCTGSDVVTTFNGAAGWTCGCSSTSAGSWWALLALAVVARRRR